MLEELRIRSLGVIDDAVLPLGPGLTAVTGETGAGKTMVISGLLLLFGGRADAGRVRGGADQASVDGHLELPADSPAVERVLAAGGQLDDGTGLVLRRTVSAAGRSRAYVGGAPVPAGVLTELAERLLTVHGQADQMRLTRPADQRAALDRYAGLDLAEYATAFRDWRSADEQLHRRLGALTELRRESELLEHGLREIEQVDPQPGEDAELAATAARLGHADALRLAARGGHDALLGDADDPAGTNADVHGLLGGARRELGAVSGADPELDALADRLADLAALAADLGLELGRYAADLDADPARLAAVEQRRAALVALVRRYAVGPDAGVNAVLRWARDAAARLAEIDPSDEAVAALTARRDAAARRTAELAAELSTRRTEHAAKLAAAVSAELGGLAMAQARIEIGVRRRPAGSTGPALTVAGAELSAGPEGIDDVEFLLQAHPDAPLLPLGRSASGGELSRVMLAVEVCLADTDPLPTMVFDEVDAGVGGRAAVEVGRRLAQLSDRRQVLVVTHLPQVAAYADRHLVVDRGAAVTASDVRLVTGADRVGELARMLAGTDSATAREHAAELLDAAARDRGAGAPGPPAAPRRRSRAKVMKTPS